MTGLVEGNGPCSVRSGVKWEAELTQLLDANFRIKEVHLFTFRIVNTIEDVT